MPGGIVFLQSDIEFVAMEMCDRFAAHPAFHRLSTGEWLTQNPLPVSTEREISTIERGEPNTARLRIVQVPETRFLKETGFLIFAYPSSIGGEPVYRAVFERVKS